MTHYRGFEIRDSRQYRVAHWPRTYSWGRAGNPIGYEPSVGECKRAIDDELDLSCIACGDTGLVRVDPFEQELAPCPDCPVQP